MVLKSTKSSRVPLTCGTMPLVGDMGFLLLRLFFSWNFFFCFVVCVWLRT